MKTQKFSLAIICFLAPLYASAAIIPAGTEFVVRTLDVVSSVDVPGTTFPAQLQNNLGANGKVLLPAGTKLVGTVVTSRRLVGSEENLTVDVVRAQVANRTIPIKTTGAVYMSNDYRTRGGMSISRASYVVPAGKMMTFRLGQPIKL